MEVRSPACVPWGRRGGREDKLTSSDHEVDIEDQDRRHADHVLRLDRKDRRAEEDESGPGDATDG